MTRRRIKRCVSNCAVPCRVVFTILCAMGLFLIFALRSNLSVTIVAMVKHPQTNISEEDLKSGEQCPNPHISNITAPSEDGPFSWNLYQQGLLHGAFFYGAAVSHIPGAWLAQVAGGKWVFGGGMAILSLLTFLIPAASYAGFGLVVTIRVIQGLAEGVCYPAMYNMMARWAPKNERTVLLGITSVGSMFGNIAVFPLSSYLCKHGFSGGWPSVFYVTAIMGLIWCVLWVFLGSNSPEEHLYITQTERFQIENTRDISKRSFENYRNVPWKSIFTCQAIWALIAVRFAAGWGYFTLLTELPTYLKTVHHFKLKSNGSLNSMVYVCQIIGTLAGSFISDYIRARNWVPVNTIRKGFVAFAFLSAGILLCFVTLAGCNVTAVVALLLCSMVCFGTISGGELATFVDLAPQYAGMVYGICSVFTSISGFITPQIVGAIVKGSVSISQWAVVFYVCLAIYVVCTLIFSILGSSQPQKWADGNSTDDANVETELQGKIGLNTTGNVLSEYRTFQQVHNRGSHNDI